MKRLLIIDDDQFILKVYKKKFETEGMHADMAADARAALTALRASPPDLVLLDLMLPGMDGVELLKQIRLVPGCEKLPVVVFSNSSNESLLAAARAAGANECLNKNSVSPNRLTEVVRACLADAPRAPNSAGGAGAPTGFREEIRARLLQDAAAREQLLQEQLQNLSVSEPGPARTAALLPLRDTFHRLSVEGADAGFRRLALLSRATALMLADLHEHPEDIHAGTFRTLTRAVENVAPLFTLKPAADLEPELPAMTVVLHDQPGIAALLAESLRATGQPAVAFREPVATLAFLEENPIDVLVVALDLAHPNGHDVVRRLHALPGRAHVPSILLSNQPAGVGTVPTPLISQQVLAFPYTAYEVVVTTVVKLVRRN